MQQVFFWATIGVIFLGIAGLVTAGRYWPKFSRNVTGYWTKFATYPVTILSGLSTAWGTFESPERRVEWWPNAVAGVFCVVVWLALRDLIDAQTKQSERSDGEKLRLSEDAAHSLVTLFDSVRAILERKEEAFAKAVRSNKHGTTVKFLRDSLRPANEVDSFCTALCTFFQGRAHASADAIPNFRAVFYVCLEGVMTPCGGGSYKNSHWEPSPSFEANRDSFSVGDAVKPSLTARCVRGQATLIVEDTVAAAERGEFFFLHDGQRSYLRSIVAYHVGKVLIADRQLAESAIVVDTNLPGYFREDDRKSLEFFLREFACRIKLEQALAATLSMGVQ